MIKGVLFDCDGLMFNTEVWSNQAFYTVTRRASILLDEEFFQGIIGATREAAQSQIDRFPGLEDLLGDISKLRTQTIYDKAKETGSLNQPGLVELLTYLKQESIPAGVASSSFRPYVDTLLQSIGFVFPFESIMTGDQITHSKPNPEIFLKAAGQLQISPDECLVLEDSLNGVKAGHAGGFVVGYIHDQVHLTDQDKKAYVDIEFPSLKEVIPYLENQKDPQRQLANKKD